jgi:DNA (cytosine-5)-methyltransferase 1
MTKKLLDLYCKAGGAGMGYYRAGWDVVGVDIEPQPRYPFGFVCMNAITAIKTLLDGLSIQVFDRHYYLSDFSAIHASPPCQKNSTMTKGLWKDRLDGHPELIAPTRELLKQAGLPYIIENVPTAPLISPTILCGSMFGLGVRRHRLFETSFPVIAPSCNHGSQKYVVAVYGHSGGSSKRDGLKFGGVDTWKAAMGIDWMTGNELAEAIPPAYTEYIARFIK